MENRSLSRDPPQCGCAHGDEANDSRSAWRADHQAAVMTNESARPFHLSGAADSGVILVPMGPASVCCRWLSNRKVDVLDDVFWSQRISASRKSAAERRCGRALLAQVHLANAAT